MNWNCCCSGKRNSALAVLTAALFVAGLLTACGQEKEPEQERKDVVDQIDQQGQSIEDSDYREEQSDAGRQDTDLESDSGESSQEDLDRIKEQFGENCIAEQTFEVELSEYPEPVWFVPKSPSQTGQGLEIEIMKNGEVLTEFDAYVPDTLAGENFTSLDAVSFYDVNFDNRTDIVLIETYGNSSFAAVYCGVGEAGTDEPRYFVLYKALSEALSEQVNPLTVTEIRNFISGGKRNGEFDSYQEAYEAVARLRDMETEEEIYDMAYDLIYVDEDDIPELVVCHQGYSVSLYTYWDGAVYALMDDWGYGAMGNAGYAYVPRRNNIVNDNSDYAGAILYTTYMAVSNHQSVDVVACIETYNFDDVNQNGYPDEEELDSLGMYGVSYIDGVEITAEEAASYKVGDYEWIEGSMTFAELLEVLGR